MHIRLDYGETGIEIDMPGDNVVSILRQSPASPLADVESAIAASLSHPIGSAPLADLARGRTSACVVVCDVTRPVPNTVLLPPILSTIEQAGVPRDAITILVATGTHRPNVALELDRLVGTEISSSYHVVNHDCRAQATHRWLGYSPNRVPIWLDAAYCDADLRVTVGLIEPHFMAGYSGGRKLIMPGIAAFETVQHWHCPRFLESPLAGNDVVTGNPVHEEALAIARLARPDMIVDVTLDESNRMTGIFAGDLERAWEQGVEFARSHVRAGAPEAADIVLTSSAGYPLDATFYQTVKGMVGALPVVKQGGTIIIAAECREGLGSPQFADALLRIEDLETFVAEISAPGVFVPEEWQIEELARAARRARILFVTGGIPGATLARCFVTPAPSLESAVETALERHGRSARIIAIPRGPYVIPFVS